MFAGHGRVGPRQHTDAAARGRAGSGCSSRSCWPPAPPLDPPPGAPRVRRRPGMNGELFKEGRRLDPDPRCVKMRCGRHFSIQPCPLFNDASSVDGYGPSSSFLALLFLQSLLLHSLCSTPFPHRLKTRCALFRSIIFSRQKRAYLSRLVMILCCVLRKTCEHRRILSPGSE